MWYVIQTLTGREEELVRMVRRILPKEVYTDCFVAYYERVWRRQQRSLVHVERLFPGYVFILADDPDEIYQRLKDVPAMSRLISDGMFTFLPLEAGEEAFFEEMLDAEHIVRLSYVEKDVRGRVFRITGPLKQYAEKVQQYQYKKRYVLVRVQLLGHEKLVALGIILQEDIRQEIAYGKVEAPLVLPRIYQMEEPEEERSFLVGEQVTVIAGELSGMRGVVWKVRKSTVDIGVRLFGQDMPMEVPVGCVCRASV